MSSSYQVANRSLPVADIYAFPPSQLPLSLSAEEAIAQLVPTSTNTPKGNLLPIYASLPADVLTPVIAFLRLTDGAKPGESFLLESVVRGETAGRWSFVGARESTLVWH